MAEVILKDIVKVYPYVDKKPKKSLFGKKNEAPQKKTNYKLQIRELLRYSNLIYILRIRNSSY